ncbi:host cell surface-exposed lipoprotein [Salinibacterium amurskyense]|uniref:Host cell surface-exposed lipoprotein n=2 Tax=Salinibacterium amurskyense TaxID=205941 RepID=A0A2M9D3R5_9MICO|nr:host cell surface-exposed lipoprotein [Salinibacterium amurskyense]GHD83580.1 hypothetical protein GCM10007394_24260 [Salinibacterium amurskyense]
MGFLLGAAAIVVSIFALKKQQNKALSIIGMGLGGLAALTSSITTILLIVGLASTPSSQSFDSELEPVASPSASPTSTPTAEVEPTQTPEPVAEPDKPTLTTSQSNAVQSGESYLDYTGFSRSGLIDQLEYEGYSTADATFAVDFIAPDWNHQAAVTAEAYLDYSSFSRQGLIDQLIYEGFSQAQAEYGVSEAGY